MGILLVVAVIVAAVRQERDRRQAISRPAVGHRERDRRRQVRVALLADVRWVLVLALALLALALRRRRSRGRRTGR